MRDPFGPAAGSDTAIYNALSKRAANPLGLPLVPTRVHGKTKSERQLFIDAVQNKRY